MRFDYFYGNEAEQFTFYRIPKVLVTSQEFRKVSDSAKLLYGLMLDRMGLSVKNGWFDEQNRAYIYFKTDEIMELMCCATEKANVLNGYHTSANYDLLTGILRDEWGFEGVVTSDWNSFGIHGLEAKAGNDIKMPWGYPDELYDFITARVLPKSYVDACVKRILELIIKIDC